MAGLCSGGSVVGAVVASVIVVVAAVVGVVVVFFDALDGLAFKGGEGAGVGVAGCVGV